LGSFERHAIATRRRPSQGAYPPPRRRAVSQTQPTSIDPKSGEIVRGLLFGAPIGLAIWVMLALMVWNIA